MPLRCGVTNLFHLIRTMECAGARGGMVDDERRVLRARARQLMAYTALILGAYLTLTGLIRLS
jgi:hypothetical protein